jgi:hypothetical protein
VTSPLPTAPAPRASDADRHATVAALQDAVACGRLSPEEGSERMAAAYATRHLHDLPPLTADLPAATPAAPAAPGWPALLALVALQVRVGITGSPSGSLVSRRAAVAVAGLVLVLLLLAGLGAGGLHLLGGGPHGLGGPRVR